MRESYDFAVIGAGPGGYSAAVRAAQRGLSVALIEEGEVGGACLNRGCIPTKALLHAAELFREMQHAEALGLSAQGVGYSLAAMYARKNEVVQRLRGGVEQLLKANKIDVLRGVGQLLGAGRVGFLGGGEAVELRAAHVLLAAGSEPAVPPIEGMDLPGVMTSDGLLAEPPEGLERLVIVGGGVIGAEFASLFAALGVAVTVIEAAPRLLPGMDDEISRNLAMLFKRRGVQVLTDTRLMRIEQTDTGLRCLCETPKGPEMPEGGRVLVAVGRRARTEGLLADGCGLAAERGGLAVNAQLETALPGVYAVGDLIKGGIQLAHAATAQGLSVAERVSGGAPETDLSLIPACVYTNPEIASVGLTEREAEARGLAVRVGRALTAGNGRALIARQDRGFIKIVTEAESGRLLGAQLMCDRATDLIGELASALVNGLTARNLRRAVRAHPTFGEAVGEALEAL